MKTMSLLFLCVLALASAQRSWAQAPNPTLLAIPGNTALDLGAYPCVGPLGETPAAACKKITDYSTFVYHPVLHQFLMFGGGHAATFRDDVDVFDFTTLTWGHGDVSTPCSGMSQAQQTDYGSWVSTNHPHARHVYDLLVVAENTGDLVLLRQAGEDPGTCGVSGYNTWRKLGPPHQYNPVTHAWTPSIGAKAFSLEAAEYDPVSGKIVIVGQGGLYTYDPVARTTSAKLASVPGAVGYSNNLVYYPPTQKMYYLARGTPTLVFEVTLNRTTWGASTVVQVAGMGGAIPNSIESGWDYEPVTQTIGGGVLNGQFFTFHPPTKQWTQYAMVAQSAAGKAIGSQAFHALKYDPVDDVFVFLTSLSSGYRTWAYRLPHPAVAPAAPTELTIH